MPRELDARYTHRGIYSAWLSKAKGDTAKAKWIQSSGRRYFSIDFDGQIVFYSHGETDKKISLPIAFRDILGASLATSEEGSPQASMRRSFSGIMARRPNSCEFPFTLHTRDRRIRLAADSEADAFSWVEMLNAAHRYGQESLTAAASGTDSSHQTVQSQSTGTGHFSPCVSSSKGSQSTADGDELTGGASSPATWSESEAMQTTPTAERAERANQADSESQAPLLQDQEAASASAAETPLDVVDGLLRELREAQNIPSNVTGKRPSQLQISAEDNAAVPRAPQPSRGTAAPSAARLARQAEDAQRPAAAAALCADRAAPNHFQASDFGFEDGPESDWDGSPEHSPVTSPRKIGPPAAAFGGGWLPSDEAVEAATAGMVHEDEVNSWDGSEDEGSDDIRKAREERIQADLFLVRQPSAGHSRNHSRREHCEDSGRPALESAPGASSSATCASHAQDTSLDGEQAARIAADLSLLPQPASSSSSSGRKAPRTKTQARKKKADAVPQHSLDAAPLEVAAPAQSEEALQARRVAADLALLPRPLVGGRHPGGYGGYGGNTMATMADRPTGGYGPSVR